MKSKMIDLEVATTKKQILNYLEEGNKVRLMFVELSKKEQKIIVTDKTMIFLHSKSQVST